MKATASTCPVWESFGTAPRERNRNFGLLRTAIRIPSLLALSALALADSLLLRCVDHGSVEARAHARARWQQRWSRIARRVLGLRVGQHGDAPVSGIVITDRLALLEAIVLASLFPCVFVVGEHIRKVPILGRLARLGGAIFFDRTRRCEIVRVNFMIQRALRRRLIVVIAPGCPRAGKTEPHRFASELFQSAAELSCTLTATLIRSETHAEMTPGESIFSSMSRRLAYRSTRVQLDFGKHYGRRAPRKVLARKVECAMESLLETAA